MNADSLSYKCFLGKSYYFGLTYILIFGVYKTAKKNMTMALITFFICYSLRFAGSQARNISNLDVFFSSLIFPKWLSDWVKDKQVKKKIGPLVVLSISWYSHLSFAGSRAPKFIKRVNGSVIRPWIQFIMLEFLMSVVGSGSGKILSPKGSH